MRAMTSAVEANVTAEVPRWTLAAELLFDDGAVRVNGSPDDVTLFGETFIGVGGFGKIGEIEDTTEIKALEVPLQLSGIPSDMFEVARAAQYQMRPAKIWIAPIGADWRVLPDPILMFSGRMLQMNCVVGKTMTVEVVLGNTLVDWETASIRRYTEEDQRRLYPTDRFFEFVTSTATTNIVWPAKSFWS